MTTLASPCEQYLTALSSMDAKIGDFYLLLGREWLPSADAELNAKYADGAERECYRNAYMLAQDHPELIYCEGFACAAGLFPMHHAWCVTTSAQVIDPTWASEQTSYWGIPMQLEFVRNFIQKTQVWGVLGEHVSLKIAQLQAAKFIHPDWLPSHANQDKWHQISLKALCKPA